MTPPIDTAFPAVGVLLCGGASRRMGQDKALLDLGGEPLFRRPAAALAATCEMLVQVGGEPLPGLGWRTIPDLRADAGPAAGIESALAAFPGAAVLVLGVDLPFAGPELLRPLLTVLQEGPAAVVPRHGGRWHPLVSAWSPQALPSLVDWLNAGERALQPFLDRLPATPFNDGALEAIGGASRLLTNVNTPANLAQARAHLEELGR